MSRSAQSGAAGNERAGGASATRLSQLSPLSQLSQPSQPSHPPHANGWLHLTQGWSPEDWDDFEERAAILEYEAGKPRELAEALAAAMVENRRSSFRK